MIGAVPWPGVDSVEIPVWSRDVESILGPAEYRELQVRVMHAVVRVYWRTRVVRIDDIRGEMLKDLVDFEQRVSWDALLQGWILRNALKLLEESGRVTVREVRGGAKMSRLERSRFAHLRWTPVSQVGDIAMQFASDCASVTP